MLSFIKNNKKELCAGVPLPGRGLAGAVGMAAMCVWLSLLGKLALQCCASLKPLYKRHDVL